MTGVPQDHGVVVLSPHHDDAVLGCTAILQDFPGSTVITVFSGTPAPQRPVTDWDARCGFSNACEAMAARGLENSAALVLLGAQGADLGLLDSQYRDKDPEPELSLQLASALRTLEPSAVFLPLGLFHEDHHAVLKAGLRMLPDFPHTRWHAYTEALYRRKPGLVQQRLAELMSCGIQATPWQATPRDPALKTHAVAAYASQLQPLGLVPGKGDDAAPECYWELEPLRARS